MMLNLRHFTTYLFSVACKLLASKPNDANEVG